MVNTKLIMGLIVTLIVVSMVLIPLQSIIVVHAEEIEGKKDVKVRVANLILKRVSNRIEDVLRLAERYDIKIPENMTVNVDLAMEILNNASGIVKNNPHEAIRMAIKASWIFRPVAIYVLKSIPEGERKKLMNRALENAIEVRGEALNKFKNVVNWLEDKNIKIPDEIKDDIATAEELLNQAKETIESGNYTTKEVVHLLATASMIMGKATGKLHRFTGHVWRTATVIDFSLHRVVNAVLLTGKAINASIEAIKGNNTQKAMEMVSRAINVTNGLSEFLARALEIAKERNVNENITEAIEALYNATVEVKIHLEEAKTSLEEEDTFTALSELEIALNIIVSTIENYKDVLKGFNKYVNLIERTSGVMHMRLGKKLREIAVRKAAWIIFHLEKTEMRLHRLYRLYQKGSITEDQFHGELDKIKNALENLKEKLEKLPHIPRRIINKIDKILQWIETVY